MVGGSRLDHESAKGRENTPAPGCYAKARRPRNRNAPCQDSDPSAFANFALRAFVILRDFVVPRHQSARLYAFGRLPAGLYPLRPLRGVAQGGYAQALDRQRRARAEARFAPGLVPPGGFAL